MKIVVLDGYSTNPGDLSWDAYSRHGEFVCHDFTPPELVARHIGDAEIVIANDTPLDAAAIAAAPRLRYIGLLATGFDAIDIAAARSRGIPVTNVPAYGTMAVAQHALALLLEICNRVGHYAHAVRRGRWTNEKGDCYWDCRMTELSGKTMGVVGFGRIGRAFARVAVALGMDVLANRSDMARPPEDAGVAYAPLDELYARSDVVSLHAPLLESTRGMIDAAAIAKMRDGVILINTARGALVREDDLVRALHDGKIAAYGADVALVEPVPPGSPLLSAPNCLITPHNAWAPLETRRRLLAAAADNLAAYLDGVPVNVVNP